MDDSINECNGDAISGTNIQVLLEKCLGLEQLALVMVMEHLT